jgi:hypothetical protein
MTDMAAVEIKRRYEAGVPLGEIAAWAGYSERTTLDAALGRTKGLLTSPAERARRPACMDSDEFGKWQDENRILSNVEQAESPCGDCLPVFALEMRAEDRCDGIPMGVEDEDRPLPPIKRHHKWPNLRLGPAVEAKKRREQTYQQGLRAESLANEGHTQTQIAYHMGVSASAVSKYLDRLQRSRREGRASSPMRKSA